MPLVHRILITLRTLMEDDDLQPPYNRKRKSSNNNNNRNSQTTAMVLTFRELFRSGGLNVILDEMEFNNRRQSRRNSRAAHPANNNRINDCAAIGPVNPPIRHQPRDSRVVLRDQQDDCAAVHCSTNQPRRHPPGDSSVVAHRDQQVAMTPYRHGYEGETLPLLQEESVTIPCADLVVSHQIPFYPSGFFNNLALVVARRINNKKPEQLTVPLNPSDENKTVETLRKVLKWSPRKQNSATFALSLPNEEKHAALAVVENAVNTVKEEQLRKKKRKFLWLKFC